MFVYPLDGAIPPAGAFGRRRVRPRICIADAKHHIRIFLAEALEELGFLTCECADIDAVTVALGQQQPDLVVIGLSAGGVEAAEILRRLAENNFGGKVLLLGPRGLPMVAAVCALGETLGLNLLPVLGTPFDSVGLRDSVSEFLPIEAPPAHPVDVAEALDAGWLELWYQPKLDTRTLSVSGTEALIRMRHPAWGIISPDYFIPSDGDPHFRAMSDFVIDQAVSDWRYFISEHGPIELAINLPIDFLQDTASVRGLCRRIPDHAGFTQLIVEINGTEILRHMPLLDDLAREVRFHNICLSIDDMGAEWPSFASLAHFPFVEIKVDRKFIAGCADDRLKQLVCRRIIALAKQYGARTVAEGVETRAEFQCARDLGFDMVQGFFIAKPMNAKKFANTILRRPVVLAR
jgi:EAL domain-containing protein (putative c-di-GMP-specific phosphodiesterase class I)/CheY-like chemotaxis protein